PPAASRHDPIPPTPSPYAGDAATSPASFLRVGAARATGCGPFRSPLAPWGRGAGGEGAALGGTSPLTPNPSPQRGEGGRTPTGRGPWAWLTLPLSPACRVGTPVRSGVLRRAADRARAVDRPGGHQGVKGKPINML